MCLFVSLPVINSIDFPECISLVRTRSSESLVGFPHFPLDELDTISACPIPSKTENQRYFLSLLTTPYYCCFSLFLFTFTTGNQSSLPLLSPSSSAYGKFIKPRRTFCLYSGTTFFYPFSSSSCYILPCQYSTLWLVLDFVRDSRAD